MGSHWCNGTKASFKLRPTIRNASPTMRVRLSEMSGIRVAKSAMFSVPVT